MTFKLVHASPAQQQAAWAKIFPELVSLAKEYAATVHVPFVDVEGMVIEKLNSPEFKVQAMAVIDDGIDAALNVQEPAPPAPAPPTT